jgi:tetratricopeptide (TPR) repeat protein
VLLALLGCSETPSAPPGAEGASAAAPSPAAHGQRRTTDGAIAVGNLDAQIAGTERLARGRALSVAERASLADMLTQRGQVLGRISDYDAAETVADELVRDAAEDGRAWLARARVRATFHRFDDALADLAAAERLGIGRTLADGVRAGILQATGREHDAFEIRHRLSADRGDILTLGGEATVEAARGRLDEAERLFTAAVDGYRDVSPFPVVWVEFQRALMWMREQRWEQARTMLRAAHERLPQHVQVQGHLAEVEAALGHGERAVELFRPLAESVEDPDYAAQLARILIEAGRTDEARPWRERAAARYEDLTTRHPEAYADHAAEFWLAAGGNPKRALAFAERNLTLRPTVRAWELVVRTARASGDDLRACAAARGAREAGYLYAAAREVVDAVLERCEACAE